MTASVNYEFHAKSLREDPLYLDRCQVNTPDTLVDLAWRQVRSRREAVGNVIDFGAGDARFAQLGGFSSYLGYEIDAGRFAASNIPRVTLVNRCAFSHNSRDADLCIGNPPYVRNQDLPRGWRQMASSEIERRTGVALSGLANAWQYFMMLALSSVKSDGLVVQIVPYEWVSRPAAKPVRQWITEKGWDVNVYRLPEDVFGGVLTAASISVIDKRAAQGRWRYHDISIRGVVQDRPSPTTAPLGVVPYTRAPRNSPCAKRGLSPGTQKYLTLTEGERVHAGLRVDADVVRCVASLRLLPAAVKNLSLSAFKSYYQDAGLKCWLVRTDREPSASLRLYLDSVDSGDRQTATCSNRPGWWRFKMPAGRAQILLAQAFKGAAPKMLKNDAAVVPVGGVAGIYDLPAEAIDVVLSRLSALDLQERLVPYAKQMHKLEINQINTLLQDVLSTLANSSFAIKA